MAIKKTQLYASLWKSCDELRGGMDASQYKDYVLTLLFVKYVSDKYAGREDAAVIVPEGGSFADMVAARNKVDIGDRINKIIRKLYEENDLYGEIEVPDFNDEERLGKDKEMVDRLSRLIGIFQNPGLNFSKNRADGDDLLGDAYEYLMRHFATESGKSKGQFYTPAEVSHILASVINMEAADSGRFTVYDPTCGSGSLLLKAADQAGREISLYGQENDNATKSLSVMNMWMHGYPDAEIWKGNTLSSPHWTEEGRLKRFDRVVANPPFSYKSWTQGFQPDNDQWGRFDDYGIPPAKNGDYAFLLHILKSLKSTGKGAVILPHGVLFRGNAEVSIRENLIRRGYIKGIIGLPANLFYGTGIPACVIVLDKENAENRPGIFMVDASKGFIKDGNKNRLRDQDIHRIVDAFTRQQGVPGYSRMVPKGEIEGNDYNLNLPRYIDSQEAEDIQDLGAHLKGGIPERDIEALAPFWQVYPSLKAELFAEDRPGYVRLQVKKEDIKSTIFAHPEFIDYGNTLTGTFAEWQAANESRLTGIDSKTKPGTFIHHISESLLEGYRGKALIDPYDVYQHLMDYWAETMKDDLYILVEDGWKAQLEPVTDAKGKVKKGEFDCDLLPKPLVIARYFAKEQAELAKKQESLESYGQAMEELNDEHGGEDGLLAESQNDKGKLTKTGLKARQREIKGDADYQDEMEVVQDYLDLLDKESAAKKELKAAEKALDKHVMAKYPQLTEAEVKKLVVHDKWLHTLRERIQGEIDAISQRLTRRITDLAERYAQPLPEVEAEVAAYSEKVSAHLANMGW